MGLKAGDANLYRYCGNAPVIYVDPSGMNPPARIARWLRFQLRSPHPADDQFGLATPVTGNTSPQRPDPGEGGGWWSSLRNGSRRLLVTENSLSRHPKLKAYRTVGDIMQSQNVTDYFSICGTVRWKAPRTGSTGTVASRTLRTC